MIFLQNSHQTKQLLGMYIAKCAMWYIILVTTFPDFLLDATTGLQHGVLLQIQYY